MHQKVLPSGVLLVLDFACVSRIVQRTCENARIAQKVKWFEIG